MWNRSRVAGCGLRVAYKRRRSTLHAPRSTQWFVILLLVLTACGRGGERLLPTYEYMPNMMDSPAVKAQEEPMRVPPEGTLPLGFAPYPYGKDEGDRAAAELVNPLAPSMEVYLRGQKVFDTFCAVCHGPTGKGNGSIVPKFPQPPTLHSEKVREWSDGRIYHVITMGQNLMPSYATQITPEERWAVIHYVRVLQRAVHPRPEDVEVFKKALKEKTYP